MDGHGGLRERRMVRQGGSHQQCMGLGTASGLTPHAKRQVEEVALILDEAMAMRSVVLAAGGLA
jgi:hypothetical protein